MPLLMALHSLQRSEGFFKVYSRLLCRTMLYDDIATTIILLPSVTKTFAMSTVFYSTVALAKKGILERKLNAMAAKELVKARELCARGAQMND